MIRMHQAGDSGVEYQHRGPGFKQDLARGAGVEQAL